MPKYIVEGIIKETNEQLGIIICAPNEAQAYVKAMESYNFESIVSVEERIFNHKFKTNPEKIEYDYQWSKTMSERANRTSRDRRVKMRNNTLT